MTKLRDYQSATVEDIREKLRKGDRQIVVYSPTGGGKTVMFSEIATLAAAKGNRVWIVVDRVVLLRQTFEKLQHFNVGCNIPHASYKKHPCNKKRELIEIISIDTLRSALKRTGKGIPDNVKLIIIDECHHSYSNKYDVLFEHSAKHNVPLIGFTATPERTNKREALSIRYQSLVISATMLELTDKGFLTPLEVKSLPPECFESALSEVEVTRGDYNQTQLGKMMKKPEFIDHAFTQWRGNAVDKLTIIFTASIDHAETVAKKWLDNGVSAIAVHSNISPEEREEIYRKFESREIQVLIAVGVLTEGFDVPGVECVVMLRPTKSVVVYIQQVGRGLRIAKGKSVCLLLDLVNNYVTHGHPYDYVPESLGEDITHLPKEGEAPKRVCPWCDAEILAALRRCPECGSVLPLKKVEDIELVLRDVVTVTNEFTFRNNIEPYNTPKGFYQQQLIKAIIRQYKPEYAVAQFKKKYDIYPNIAIMLHSAFSKDFSHKDILYFYEYLYKVSQKHNLDGNWVTKWVAREFGNEVSKQLQ